MQIIRADVTKATAHAGEPIVRVLFCAEGGSRIAFDMVKVEMKRQEVWLDRGKAGLVETAAFRSATNEYDAESNGNFDEVAVAAAKDKNSSVYLFEYRDGQRRHTLSPVRMPNLDAARAEAIRDAIKLLSALQPGSAKLRGWLVRVRTANGVLLLAVDAQEAEVARRAAVA